MEIANLFKNGYTIFNNVVEKDEVDKVLKKSLKLPLYSNVDLSYHEYESNDIAAVTEIDSKPYPFTESPLTLARFSIKDIIKYDNYQVLQHQNWYWTDISSHWDELKNKIFNKIQEIYKNYELSLEDTYITLHVMPPGSFIEHHNDGVVKNRLGAFLLPLHNKPPIGKGGDLVISEWKTPTRQVSDLIESKVGDMILLDFTENNIEKSLSASMLSMTLSDTYVIPLITPPTMNPPS